MQRGRLATASCGGEEDPTRTTAHQRPQLGDSLAAIAEEGTRTFYRGDIARLIAAEIEGGGGLLGLADLEAHRPSIVEALEGRRSVHYHTHRADDIMILEEGNMAEYGDRERLASDPTSRFYNLLQTGLEEVLV